MNREDALYEHTQKIRSRYHPEGHPHPVGSYVSGSQLVKKSAEELASEMIDKIEGEEDDVPAYYTFRGDSLGDAALQDMPHGECRLRYELPEIDTGNIADNWDPEEVDLGASQALNTSLWRIQGHPDGVDIINGWVFVDEHKSHGMPTDNQIEAARRQGLLYLAMMFNAAEANGGRITFENAEWAPEDKRTLAIDLDEHKPGGVVTAVAPTYPPPIVEPEQVTRDELDDLLNYYEDKAIAIVKSVLKKDPTADARMWDNIHDEFDNRIAESPEDEEDLKKLIGEYEKAHEKQKEWDERKKELKSELMRLHDISGEKRIGVEDDDGKFKSTLVERDGGRKVSVSDVEEAVERGLISEGAADELIGEKSGYRYVLTKASTEV
jgi:hypothetical protein